MRRDARVIRSSKGSFQDRIINWIKKNRLLGLVIVVGFSYLTWIIFSHRGPDDAMTRKLNQIKGHYVKPSTELLSIDAWWHHAGNDFAENRIRTFEMQVSTPPYTDWKMVYYERSSTAALQDAQPLAQDIKIERIEVWRDYVSGIHALVDMSYSKNQQIQKTVLEIEDDEARPLVIYPASKASSKIYVITTVYRRPQHFKRFVKCLEQLYMQTSHNFGLIITMYEGDERDTEEVLKKSHLMTSANSKITIKILKKKLPFKKAPSLQESIDLLKSDEIAFMVDVDMTFEPDVLDRVTRYVVKGKRAWCPIVWYNDDGQPGTQTFFAYGGTGIIALYKSDIDKFGGYDVARYSDKHGFEDTDFFFRTHYVGLQIARSQESTFQHHPHSRDTWEAS